MTDATPRRVQLTYVRHGETAWSLTRRHTGATDLPLTVNGEAQARGLRPWLAGADFTHVFASPRLRARLTCQLAGVSNAPEIEPDAAEWDYGDYEGRRSQDIRLERPGWDIYRDGCPNGESPRQISDRADRLIAKLVRLGGHVVLFAHGQFGLVLVARWIGLDVARARHFRLDPASISVLALSADEPESPVIAVWNASGESARLSTGARSP